MLDSLVSADDLIDYPGAPFTEDVTAAAGAQVRRVAGWHIAPQRTEILTLDSPGGCILWLPSLQITEVVEVTDVATNTEITDVQFDATGRLYSPNGFPCGYRAVTVEFTHGYESCPPELLPIIADYCNDATTDADVQQESLGSWSRTIRDGTSESSDTDNVPQALAALSIAWGVA